MNPPEPKPLPFQQNDLAAYDAELQQGLSWTGESKGYFARGRLAWLAGRLQARNIRPARTILDYGCGGGDTTELLSQLWPDAAVIGVDTSSTLIAAARRTCQSSHCEFHLVADLPDSLRFDLVYCNGVFHHVAESVRPDVLAWIRARLEPDGHFALWENNSWNPAARWVMRRIPFDRDARLLSPARARRLLAQAGFAVLDCDFAFIFPHGLRWARPLEKWLCKLPLGAQYQLLCRRT